MISTFWLVLMFLWHGETQFLIRNLCVVFRPDYRQWWRLYLEGLMGWILPSWPQTQARANALQSLKEVAVKDSGTSGLSSVQFSQSVVSNSLWPHESQHARPPCPSPTPGVHSDSTSIDSVMPSCHLILCRPLLLLPPIPPSIRVFSNESTLRMKWPKYWSFSFSIIPSNSFIEV